MKKNHRLLKCSYLLFTAFLMLIGYRTVETPPSLKTDTKWESYQEAMSVKAEDFLKGTNCPLHPTEKGFLLEYKEGFEFPSDSELKNLKVYEFDLRRLSDKEIKKQAQEKAEILLGDYFPDASQTMDNWDRYHIDFSENGKTFRFQFGNGVWSFFHFKHSSKTPEIEKSENGDYQYLSYGEDLLKKLQLGVWDGQTGHLKLKSGENNTFIYQYDFDGKTTASGDFSGMGQGSFSPDTILFSYRNGYLSEIDAVNCSMPLTNLRDAKIKYHSIQELFTEAENRLKKRVSLYKEITPKYYYYYVTDADISYLAVSTGDFQRNYAFVPILDMKIEIYIYDINKEQWSSFTPHYGFHLETGEMSSGN